MRHAPFSHFRIRHLLLSAAIVLTASCQSDAPAPSASAASATPVATSTAADGTITVDEKSFKCIRDMTPVRGFFVDNIAGNIEGTLAAANAPNGAVYPPGSVVQLFPNEVMVKREKGFSPVTKDWEFFELDVDENGSTIRKRGFADVNNRFGGNCFACHVRAQPQWDLICEDDHGCEALPISDLAIHSLQNTDPRCAEIDVPFTQDVMAWFIKTFTSF